MSNRGLYGSAPAGSATATAANGRISGSRSRTSSRSRRHSTRLDSAGGANRSRRQSASRSAYGNVGLVPLPSSADHVNTNYDRFTAPASEYDRFERPEQLMANNYDQLVPTPPSSSSSAAYLQRGYQAGNMYSNINEQ